MYILMSTVNLASFDFLHILKWFGIPWILYITIRLSHAFYAREIVTHGREKSYLNSRDTCGSVNFMALFGLVYVHDGISLTEIWTLQRGDRSKRSQYLLTVLFEKCSWFTCSCLLDFNYCCLGHFYRVYLWDVTKCIK